MISRGEKPEDTAADLWDRRLLFRSGIRPVDSLQWKEEFLPIADWIGGYFPRRAGYKRESIPPFDAVSPWAIETFFMPQVLPPGATLPLILDPFVRQIRGWVREHGDEFGVTTIDRLIPESQLATLRSYGKHGRPLPTSQEARAVRTRMRANDWPELEESGVLESLADDYDKPGEVYLLRQAHEVFVHDQNAALPQLCALPGFAGLLATDAESLVKWELLDLVVLPEWSRRPELSPHPAWNEFVYNEPHDKSGTEERWSEVLRYLLNHGIDIEPFEAIVDEMYFFSTDDWSRRMSLPILVFALYLRCFHKELSGRTEEEVSKALREYCKTKKRDLPDWFLLEKATIRSLVSYSIAMDAIIEKGSVLTPTRVQRGRRKSLHGWMDLLIHRVFSNITDEVIDVVRLGPPSLFDIGVAYGFQDRVFNRNTVAAAIASARTGTQLTAEAVRAAVKRSRSDPEAINRLSQMRLEFMRGKPYHSRHPFISQ